MHKKKWKIADEKIPQRIFSGCEFENSSLPFNFNPSLHYKNKGKFYLFSCFLFCITLSQSENLNMLTNRLWQQNTRCLCRSITAHYLYLFEVPCCWPRWSWWININNPKVLINKVQSMIFIMTCCVLLIQLYLQFK